MKTIVVTGANGQLGKKIKDLSVQYPEFNFIFTDLDDLDISSAENTEAFFEKTTPYCVINCAAYTQVDKAEEESELAYAVNTDGPENLAKACARHNAELIHVSTDYVFGNSKQNHPFDENDPTAADSVYGKSKAAGEKKLQAFKRTRIVRTAWLYSEYGNNFLKTMLRLGNERKELKVVCDQISSPTYAGDLADALLRLAQQPSLPNAECEILHYANEGVCSWYDFAFEIFRLSGINCRLIPIKTEAYPTPAKRPSYSVLDKTKIKKKYQIKIPDYRESLYLCVNLL
jgi:dTDP-4-dehydrorhamnose reductase